MIEFVIGGVLTATSVWLLRQQSLAQKRRHERELLELTVVRDVGIAEAQARASAPAPHTYAPHITMSYHAGTSTYAPHLRQSVQPSNDAALPAPDVAALAGSVPSFAELLGTGSVGKGNPLVLGYASGSQLAGDWRDLYSCAIAGRSGTGKSTSQRFYACQTALHGARFVVCDPHADAGEESLAGTLAPLLGAGAALCAPASTPDEILQAVRLVRELGEARLHGDSGREPVILWIDETASLLARSDMKELAELLTRIAQEMRKVAVFASVSSQIWTGAALQGTALRDSLASVLCHRLPRNQSRMLVPADYARRTETLAVGSALLCRTNGTVDVVQVPYTSAQDVQRVARLLTDTQPRVGIPPVPRYAEHEPERTPDARQPHASAAQAYAAPPPPEPTPPVPAEHLRVVELFRAGSSIAEIVRELHGVQSNAGKRYQLAASEVQEILRRAL